MFKNFKINKFAGKFFKKGTRPVKIKEINPDRDWNIVLIFFTLIIFTEIAFGFYAYRNINSGSFVITSGGNESPVETIDRFKLNKIIKYYENKNRLFEEYKINKPEAVDPSI